MVAPRKDPGRFSVVLPLVLLVLFGCTCLGSISQASRQLSELTKLSGPLESATIQVRYHRSYHYHVEFRVAGDSTTLALAVASQLRAQQVKAQCAVGKPIVIYYEPAEATNAGKQGAANFNVYQIQTGNTIIYALAEAHQKARKEVWYLGAFTAVFAVLLSYGYLYQYLKALK